MMPLNHILRKCTAGYNLSKSQENIKHLMYMDDKTEKELETLIQTVRIYSQDIGMEFGIEKCAMLVMKSRKWHDRRNQTTKSRKNQNAKRKGNEQILGNIGSWHHQTSGDERKNKRVSRENQKVTWDKTILQELYKRDKYLGCPTHKILRTILGVDQRRLQTNGSENKKTNDLESQRWHWQAICAKKRGRKSTRHHWRQHWHINTKTTWIRTDYSHQKHYWQHDDQQNDNN